MSPIKYITEAGLKKLKEELYQFESVERPSISKQIAEARDKGDLSENAEYDAAKEAQGLLEMRIAKLKDIVASSRIIDESKLDTSKVQLLNRVAAGGRLEFPVNLFPTMVPQYTVIIKKVYCHENFCDCISRTAAAGDGLLSIV